MTVVGVVADVKARLNSDSPRSLLFMAWQEWVNQMDVVVRTSGDPLLLASAMRREINRLDTSLAVARIETVSQVIEKSWSAERFRTWLLICFAIAALLFRRLKTCPSGSKTNRSRRRKLRFKAISNWFRRGVRTCPGAVKLIVSDACPITKPVGKTREPAIQPVQ